MRSGPVQQGNCCGSCRRRLPSPPLHLQATSASGAAKKPAATGFLSSLVRSMGVSVAGTSSLTREDIASARAALKTKLMERNVAEEIAEKVCESVAAGLEGRRLGSFTRVSTVVREAVEAALTRILTPKRSIDVLRGVREAKARRRGDRVCRGGGGRAGLGACSVHSVHRPQRGRMILVPLH